MIEATDEDIRRAASEMEWNGTPGSIRRSAEYGDYGAKRVMVLARTLAKLRVAAAALEAVNDTDGHQSYATQLSEACDIASAALTQIKDEKP